MEIDGFARLAVFHSAELVSVLLWGLIPSVLGFGTEATASKKCHLIVMQQNPFECTLHLPRTSIGNGPSRSVS